MLHTFLFEIFDYPGKTREPASGSFYKINTMSKIQGYKGFNNNLKCRGYQYEVGKTFECDGKIECCENGFHFCENPFDVFGYYPPSDSRYCSVEGEGETSKDNGDSKVAVSRLHVSAEIGLKGLINAGVKFILDRVKWEEDKSTNTGDRSAATNTGDYSAATNTGNRSAATNTGDQSAATNTGNRSAATNTGNQSAATNTGDYSAATNTGDQSAATNTGNRSAATNTGNRSAATNTGNRSAATNTGDQSAATNTGNQSAATNTGYRSAASVEGKDSVAIVTGVEGKAKGSLGCWIVLTERGEWNGETYPIKEVKAFKVDGKNIKENTYYRLIDGVATEV